MSATVSIYLSASVINGQYIPVCLCHQRSVYTCLPLSTTVSIYLSAYVINGQYLPVCLCQQRSAYIVCLSAYVNNGQYIPVCLCHQRSIIHVRLHQQRSIRVCFLVSCGPCVSLQPPTGMRVPPNCEQPEDPSHVIRMILCDINNCPRVTEQSPGFPYSSCVFNEIKVPGLQYVYRWRPHLMLTL